MTPYEAVETGRLSLRRVTTADAEALHTVSSDPRVWTHYPSLRPVRRDQTVSGIRAWQESWERIGLGMWSVRLAARVIGYAGCSLRRDVWNLGYRLDADLHGKGYASEVARAALDAAHEVDPDRPVTAFLVEHNRASARVAEKVGLRLVHRAPDVGNPDPTVQRLVYADRELDAAVLAAVLS